MEYPMDDHSIHADLYTSIHTDLYTSNSLRMRDQMQGLRTLFWFQFRALLFLKVSTSFASFNDFVSSFNFGYRVYKHVGIFNYLHILCAKT